MPPDPSTSVIETLAAQLPHRAPSGLTHPTPNATLPSVAAVDAHCPAPLLQVDGRSVLLVATASTSQIDAQHQLLTLPQPGHADWAQAFTDALRTVGGTLTLSPGGAPHSLAATQHTLALVARAATAHQLLSTAPPEVLLVPGTHPSVLARGSAARPAHDALLHIARSLSCTVVFVNRALALDDALTTARAAQRAQRLQHDDRPWACALTGLRYAANVHTDLLRAHPDHPSIPLDLDARYRFDEEREAALLGALLRLSLDPRCPGWPAPLEHLRRRVNPAPAVLTTLRGQLRAALIHEGYEPGALLGPTSLHGHLR